MKNLLTSLFFLCLAAKVFTQTLTVEDFSTGYSWLTGIAHAPNDDRLFAFQKDGLIKICNANGQQAGTFLDISAKVKNLDEYGLVGLAFHPNYATNGYFYVFYNKVVTGECVVARYSRSTSNPNLANPSSELILMTWLHPESHHVGGCMKFGPDGYLYIATGDGASLTAFSTAAQNLQSYLGKILRIDVNNGTTYTVPTSNPFIGNQNALPEIYAYGLRNPWRISFDKYTGGLYIGDVGQDEREEVDYQADASTGGKNYGWPCMEGTLQFNAANCNANTIYTAPYFEYNHAATNGCSISGGVVYRGGEYGDLFGKYIYADFCSGRIWSLNTGSTSPVAVEGANVGDNDITMIEENSKGELFAVGFFSNKIYRVRSQNCAPTAFIPGDAVRTLPAGGSVPMSVYPVMSGYSYQWLLNGSPIAGQTGTQLIATQPGTYTVRVTNPGNSCQNTSAVVTVNGGGGGGNTGQIDLSLTAQQLIPTPAQWSNYSVKLSLSNAGPQAATGVKVKFAKPNGVVYVGGNTHTASQGTFNALSDEVWTVGSIPANGTTTLTVNYFMLNASAPVAYAQVTAANETDSDSQPNNGTPPSPVQDDEASTAGGNGGPTCAITASVTAPICNDNGTPTNPADDRYSFILTATNTVQGVGYQVFIPQTSQTFQGTYGSPLTIQNVPISAVNLKLNLTDNMNVNCSESVSVTVPAPCSSGTVLPDLKLTNLQVPASITHGTAFNYSFIASNIGSTPSPPTTFRVKIGPYDVAYYPLQALQPGQQASISQAMTLPQGFVSGNLGFSVGLDEPSYIVNELSENNNGASVGIQVNQGTGGLNLGDLSPTNIVLNPDNGMVSQPIQVNYTRTNFGSAPIVQTYGDRLFLSTDNILSANDIVLGNESSPAVVTPIGNLHAFFSTILLPAGTSPGSYFLIVEVDNDKLVPETNESNNIISALFTVNGSGGSGQIDLSLVAQQLTASPAQWSNYPVKLTLSNTGPQAATGVKVKFAKPNGVVYVGGNEFTASQGTFNPNGDEVWTVGSIPANGSATLTVNYFLLSATAPVAYAQVIAANETDTDSQPNNGTPPTPVQDDEASTEGGNTTPMPDITVTALTAPASLVKTANNTVSFTLSNPGNAPTATVQAFLTSIYLSTDNQLSANDLELGQGAAGPIPAGGNITGVAAVITVPATTSVGNYFLIAKADVTNTVAESNENNNLSNAVAVQVVSNSTATVDLTVSNLTVPASIVRSSTVNFSFNVNNTGTSVANLTNGITCFAIISTDNIQGNADDQYLSTTINVPPGTSIPAGGSITVSGNGILDHALPIGSYFLFASVDVLNNLLESNETNNVSAPKPFNVTNSPLQGVDLTVTSFSGNIGFFQNLPYFGYSLLSTNTGIALPSSHTYITTGFYLSSDNVLSNNDVLFHSTTLGPGFCPNCYYNSVDLIALPSGTQPGNYFVIAKVDIAGIFSETNENNNTSSIALSLVLGPQPDLTLADLQIPTSSVAAGAILSYNFDASNSGTEAAPGNFTIKSYISTDQTLSANDLQDGTIQTGNYGVGFAVQNVPGASTIPANLAAGQYYLIVKIDADGFVIEGNENNNTVVLPFTVTMGGSPCAAVTITPGPSKITIAGFSAPHVLIKVFRPNWTVAYECLDGQCANPTVVTGLGTGSHYVEVKLLNASWGEICKKTQTVGVTNIAQQDDRQRLAFDKFYPNPTAYQTTMELYSPVEQRATLDFYDRTGRLVHTMEVQLEKGQNLIEQLVFDWKSGTYNVVARGEQTALPAYGRFLKLWEE
ncbi:MAG: PQQ-dependent sugar dehydrogenase [Saprospiraceae bacterium]|nr:PQQ-dependent sugar dehydrogenase [Saprospiraceae bacterium]